MAAGNSTTPFVAEKASATVRIGAQNPAHPWWSIAERVAEALVGFHKPLLPSARISIVTPSGLQGARNNPLEVAAGALDVGITTPSSTAKMALDGTGVYHEAHPELRAIAAYPHIDFVVFAVDAATGITSFRELIDQRHPLRLVSGRKLGSEQDILTFTVEAVLRGYGASYDALQEWGGQVFYGGPTHIGGHLMLEGTANALFQEAQTARIWHDIADSRNVNFLAVDDEIVKFMSDTYGFRSTVIPPQHYRGVTEEVQTIDFSGWLVFCHENVPAEWSYALARACDRTRGEVETYPEVKRSLRTPIDPGYLFGETIIPLHEGAAAYAREQGYLE